MECASQDVKPYPYACNKYLFILYLLDKKKNTKPFSDWFQKYIYITTFIWPWKLSVSSIFYALNTYLFSLHNVPAYICSIFSGQTHDNNSVVFICLNLFCEKKLFFFSFFFHEWKKNNSLGKIDLFFKTCGITEEAFTTDVHVSYCFVLQCSIIHEAAAWDGGFDEHPNTNICTIAALPEAANWVYLSHCASVKYLWKLGQKVAHLRLFALPPE